MKRVSLLIVGLLCVSVVIYAGEVITNDTGEPATGLRVTFSAPVIIVDFGDIFTSVDSQMSASEFVFSGGTVDPWESHWFNYAPTTVSVVKAEWLTGSVALNSPQGDSSRDDLMNLGRAPTYEEIMAEIAQYPGADEPLYVPEEDEAIWLTDLEGHADIYDNDSIRINYAEWFDQSQVTRIEVYRNGIKMKFLPDQLDVLTNEQLKTFDGTYAEHSPASSHSDHAIYGYQYDFRFVFGDGSTPGILSLVINNPITYEGDAYSYNDQIWPFPWEFPSASDDVLRTELRRLRSLGFVGIALDTYYYMDSEASTVLYPRYVWDDTIHWLITPGEVSLRRILRLAREEDMKTWLRIQVQLTDVYKESVSHFAWRGSIQPHDVLQWFDSYAAVCRDMATIAEEEGVETLCLGVELMSMRQHVEEWESLVDQVRSIFSGMVTYDEATNNLTNAHCGDADFADEAGKHWEPFDRIEMNYWQNPNCSSLDTQKDQRFSVMLERFVEFWAPAFEYYRNTYPSKPLAFGELGHFICDGNVIAGWWSGESGLTDYQEAADVWATYMIAAEFFDTTATSVWTWSLSDSTKPECCLTGIRGTPAGQVVVSFIDDEATWQKPNQPFSTSNEIDDDKDLSQSISAGPSVLLAETGFAISEDGVGVRTLNLPGKLHSVIEYEDRLLISDLSGYICSMDPISGQYERHAVASSTTPIDLALHGNRLFLCQESGLVLELDATDMTRSVAFGDLTSGSYSGHLLMGIESIEEELYALLLNEETGAYSVGVYDLESGELLRSSEISGTSSVGELVTLSLHNGDLYTTDWVDSNGYSIRINAPATFHLGDPFALATYVPSSTWLGKPRGFCWSKWGFVLTTKGGGLHITQKLPGD